MTSTSTTAKRRFSFRRKAASPLADGHHKKTFWQRVYRDRYLLLLFLPCLIYYILFKYVPMWGVLISFKDFKPFIGFMDSDWVGLKHYVNFFSNPDAWRIIRNTLFLGVYSLVWCFPFPIIFALALNEVTRTRFKKFVQTISYMPHFISAVVVVSLINAMLSPSNGLFNQIIQMFGGDPVHFMAEPKYFKTVYVLSDIWQTAGYGSIVYLAALTSIDPSLYEAATVDGASKWKKLLHITLPCILPTIMTMLILRMGSIFTVGYEKIMLMYNPATYETADVISTYVYRRAFEGGEYSFSAAVGLFNSVINFIVIIVFNKISKRVSEVSLW